MLVLYRPLVTRLNNQTTTKHYNVDQNSVVGIAMGWTVQGSNPAGGEIFRTRPDRPWGPPSLLYSGYRVCFPEVKRPGLGVNHQPPFSVEVKERVELYLYSPLWVFVACSREKITVTFLLLDIIQQNGSRILQVPRLKSQYRMSV